MREREQHDEWQPADGDHPVPGWRGADPSPPLPAGLDTPVHGRRRTRWLVERWTQSAIDATRAALARERTLGTGFIFVPVLLGLGIILYFKLPREPVPGAFGVLALFGLALFLRVRAVPARHAAALGLLLVAGGAQLAQFHVIARVAPGLTQQSVTTIEGRIVAIERRADGSARYTLAGPEGARLRVTARKMQDAAIGDGLRGRARIGPPPGPAHPGGYDFAFAPRMNGIAGSGFFLGAPSVEPARSTNAMASLRDAVSRIVRRAAPGQGGAIAAALIVGDRSGIDEETSEALRRSGLAHILAISGLHMGLVTGLVLLAVRSCLSLSPAIVLRHPVRKWAAATALLSGALYLGLSGGSVSAQRAFIMAAIMLGAVLLDRRALTMRNVALAALLVLVFAPHAVLTASFQMSFAAVAALVALWQWHAARFAGSHKDRGLLPRLARGIGALALTSLVAGIATGLFAAYHFQRIAPLGLIANVLAMPVVTFLVMPMAVATALAMPLGLEGPFLAAMGWGTTFVVWVAGAVSGWSGASGEIGRLAPGTLALGAAALVILTALRTWLRWIAVPLLALTIVPNALQTQPDILIAEDGRQAAILTDGRLLPMRPRAGRFTVDIWQRAFAPGVPVDRSSRNPSPRVWRCDPSGCVGTVSDLAVAMLKTGASLHVDCRRADIIVVPFDAPHACADVPVDARPLIIDAKRLRARGAHAIHLSTGETRIKTAFDANARPWERGQPPLREQAQR